MVLTETMCLSASGGPGSPLLGLFESGRGDAAEVSVFELVAASLSS